MSILKRLTLTFLALATTAAGAQEPVAMTAEDVNAWLDGYLPYALHTGDIAGAVVAVVKDGKIAHEQFFYRTTDT